MQLYPHILLRTHAAVSSIATTLRCAGYLVTKVRRDDDLERLAAVLHVDAIVVDLPVAQAVSLAGRGRLIDVPMLVLTPGSESLRAAGRSLATLPLHDAGDQLVPAVDLLIVRRQKSHRWTRDQARSTQASW